MAFSYKDSQRIKGIYPAAFMEMDRGINIPHGWFDLLEEFVNRLADLDEELGVEVSYIQNIREHYGYLDIRVESAYPQAYDLTEEFKKRSKKVCSNCSSTNSVRVRGNYWKTTLCKKCNKERKNAII